MFGSPELIVFLPPILPYLWALWLCFRPPARLRAVLLPLAAQAVAALVSVLQIRVGGAVVLGAKGELPAGMVLRADGLSAVLTIAGTLILSVCVIYSLGYFQLHRQWKTKTLRRERFYWPLLAVLWGGLLFLWITADLLSAYLALEMLGLSAAALMVLPERGEAVNAGLRYLFFMLLGSLTYLMGAGILYAAHGHIGFEALAAAGAADAEGVQTAALALASAGLMIKAAVFPLHGWLAGAHSHAWAPVSAIHSALVVKGSFVVLLRVWMAFWPEMHAAAQFVGWAGAAAIFYGGLMALYKHQVKQIVAYSTLAQLGYLLLIFPLAAQGTQEAAQLAWQGTWLHFTSHALAKAAMFLAVGNLMLAMGRADLEGLAGVDNYLPVSLLILGFASLSIIGLPVSGGFTAKWLLLNSAILSGQWQWVVVLSAGTLLGAAYIFRIFKYALAAGVQTGEHVHLPVAKEAAAFVLALAALLLGLFAKWPLILIGDGAGGVPWP